MKIVVAFALAALALQVEARAAESPLLAAIRGDHVPTVSRLLAEGESANVRDDTGATALMYAVVYSSPAVVRQLLARGADVNAANAAGATALMWAARDAAMTRLLLGGGAAIDAKSVDGTTALLAAANHGNADAVRALLAAGADPKAVRLNTLLRAVYQAPNSDELQRLFAGAGVDTRDSAQLSPLATALALTDVAAMKRIVAAGGEFSRICDRRAHAATAPFRLLSRRAGVDAEASRSRRRRQRKNVARGNAAHAGGRQPGAEGGRRAAAVVEEPRPGATRR